MFYQKKFPIYGSRNVILLIIKSKFKESHTYQKKNSSRNLITLSLSLCPKYINTTIRGPVFPVLFYILSFFIPFFLFNPFLENPFFLKSFISLSFFSLPIMEEAKGMNFAIRFCSLQLFFSVLMSLPFVLYVKI